MIAADDVAGFKSCCVAHEVHSACVALAYARAVYEYRAVNVIGEEAVFPGVGLISGVGAYPVVNGAELFDIGHVGGYFLTHEFFYLRIYVVVDESDVVSIGKIALDYFDFFGEEIACCLVKDRLGVDASQIRTV